MATSKAAKNKSTKKRAVKSPALKLTVTEARAAAVNTSVLATLFSVSTRYIATLHSEGMPRNPDNSYPLAECIRWRVDRADNRKPKTGDARTRKEEAQAEMYEIKAKLMRGELVEITEVERREESRARQLNTYLTESFMRNLKEFENLTVNKLRVKFDEFIHKMMDAYIGEKQHA